MLKPHQRISVVDSFRCIAILMVIAYHYLYRFSPPYADTNYYPYEYKPSILQYGYFGVHFFFVISGFVIFQTLETTGTFKEFIVKRLIRLWPTLILCSTITFLCMSQYNYTSWLKFLPSLTFIPPEFWNMVLNRTEIVYIDGAYWSLFVEVIFYIVGGLLYFSRPKAFLSNWLFITFIVTIIRIITSPKNQFLFSDEINFVFGLIYGFYLEIHISYWVYFGLGIFFYDLYSKNRPPISTIAMMSILVLLEFYFLGNNSLRIFMMGILILFTILIYKESWLSFLRFKVFVWIGVVSYPLYLLHENIGLILINEMADVTERHGASYLPFVVALIMILISGLVYNYYEKPVMSFLKIKFIRKS